MKLLTKALPYSEARKIMKVGDLVAFIGRGPFSRAIRIFAGIPTHVGIILRVDLGCRVMLIESTMLSGEHGVSIRYMSDVVNSYPGEMFLISMSNESYNLLQVPYYTSFLASIEGRKYDTFQAITSIFKHLWFPESFQKLYCSELVTGALEAGMVINRINASRITPRETLNLVNRKGNPVYNLTETTQILSDDSSVLNWGFFEFSRGGLVAKEAV